MLNTKSILVPVDFSECSLNALKYAADIARTNDANLIILNVSDAGSLEDRFHGNLSIEHLVGLLDTDEILKKVRHEFLVQNGNVVREILKVQEKYKPGLIVMGTQGADNMNRKLFGTNTTAVITRAHCPVLAIPSGSSYKRIKRVVLATDQQRSNLSMLESSIDMIRSFNPDLMLLYVNGATDPAVETVYLLSQIPRGIQKHITYPNTTMYVSSHKKINEGIEHFVQKKKADLLIMITRHRSLFQTVFDKSKTKKMAIDSPVPLLAVPNS